MSFFCRPRISDSCNCLACSGFVGRVKKGLKNESKYLVDNLRMSTFAVAFGDEPSEAALGVK